MSGILWKEMLAQGMVRSRSEATRMVKAGQVKLEIQGCDIVADVDDLDLPGKTRIRTGKHMFRLMPRNGGESGFDQLRCWGEIPVTAPEDINGFIRISLSDVVCSPEEVS